MKALMIKKYITFGFVIALIILLAVNYFSYKNINEHFEDEKYLSDAVKTITTCENLRTNLHEVSASRRGYQITGDEGFLNQYHNSVSLVETLFDELRNLPSNNAKEIRILDTLGPLILKRKEMFESTLELEKNRTKKITTTQQVLVTQKGEETQDKIDHYIQQIENEENTLLGIRNSQLSRSANFTISGMVVGTSVSFLLLIIGFVLLNREISRRRKYEEELKENRNWFSTILTSIGDAVIVTDKHGNVQFMNPIAQDLTGRKIEDARGKDIGQVFNVVNEETREKLENPILKVIREGRITGLSNHSLLIDYTGKELPIDDSAAPVINEDNKILGVVLTFRDITARRKAERELIGSEKFIQSIADSIPNILYIYELKGPRISYANFQVAEKLGYSAQHVKELGSKFFEKYMHPDDYLKLTELFKKYVKAKDHVILENEYRLKNAAGEWRWFQSRDVVFTRNNDGVPVQMLGTALDVTERKKMEQELKQYYGRLEEIVGERTGELRLINERLQQEILERIRAEKGIVEAEVKFRSLVENSLVGIYIIQDDKFAYVNPKFEEIFGFSHNELNDKEITQVITEEDSAVVFENIRRRLEGEIDDVNYSYKAKTKVGRLIDVEVRGTTMEYRGKLAVIGTIMDITERVRAEEALKSQERFLRTIIDSDPTFIFVKDKDGIFRVANKAFAEFHGVTSEEILGKTAADVIREKEQVERINEDDDRVLDTGVPMDIPEMKVSSMSGETRYLHVTKVPLKSGESEPQILTVATDITERKAADDSMKKSLKEKELLLKEIHHRVKNNLQIIASLLKLQSRFIHDKRDLEIFSKSRARVETMALIHENLYRTPDIGNIDIGNYVRSLTYHLLQVYGVGPGAVNVSVNADSIKLGIDTAIPCGLLINELVSNSLKYAFPELKPEDGKFPGDKNGNGKKFEIIIDIKKENDEIKLTVSDNGIGIPEDFDYNSTQSLGMQLINTLTKQLEGNVELQKNGGTKFAFTFNELKYSQRF